LEDYSRQLLEQGGDREKDQDHRFLSSLTGRSGPVPKGFGNLL